MEEQVGDTDAEAAERNVNDVVDEFSAKLDEISDEIESERDAADSVRAKLGKKLDEQAKESFRLLQETLLRDKTDWNKDHAGLKRVVGADRSVKWVCPAHKKLLEGRTPESGEGEGRGEDEASKGASETREAATVSPVRAQ